MRRLLELLALAGFAVCAASAGAQTAFPAPPLAGTSEACMNGYAPLREQAEKRGQLIEEASGRHAPPDETCKLIGAYGQAEVEMIKYLEAHAAQCGIAPELAERLKNGHKNTEALERKVCNVAQQMQKRGPAGQINDFGDPAFQKR
jgi:hypothetical protein